MYRGKIHMERGEHGQALALYEQAEEAFRAAGEAALQAYALAMRGYVLRFQGRYADAIGCSQEALALVSADGAEERLAMALAYRNAGICHFRQGQTGEGQDAFHKALRLYEALNAPYDVGMVHHDLGFGYEMMGDLENAVVNYQAALERWHEIKNPGPWANTLNSLGVIFYLQGRYEESAQMLDEALAKSRTAGDQRVEAFVWASLGDLYRDQSTYERARQSYAQALEIAERSRAGFIQTYALNGLGSVSYLQDDLAQSKRQLQRAMELARMHRSGYEAGLCHTSLGILAIKQEDLVLAWTHLDQALECFEPGGFQRELAVTYLHRAQISFLAGDEKDALADLQRALDVAQNLAFDQYLVVEGQQVAGLLRFAQEQGIGDSRLPQLLERIENLQARYAARPEPVVQVERRQALKIYALGQPRVELEGLGIQWTTTQSRDLLFCLLQYPQGLRKEEVGSIFWPDHPPHKLDGIFRSTLYRLRRSIFRESVVFEEGLYSFNWESDYWFDVEAFEDLMDQAERSPHAEQAGEFLTRALDLYKDDYLQDVYADWCTLERERLRERRLDALESLARLCANQGKLQGAIEVNEQLVTLDPYREPAHRELMRCHFRLGDRVAAIRQYQTCAQILREDLGLSPTAKTEELYLQIIG
jgi:two-component SAPR family response regulator